MNGYTSKRLQILQNWWSEYNIYISMEKIYQLYDGLAKQPEDITACTQIIRLTGCWNMAMFLTK